MTANSDVKKTLDALGKRSLISSEMKNEILCRTYSDGYKEMSGSFPGLDYYSPKTITFPYPFKDTNYCLLVTTVTKKTNSGMGWRLFFGCEKKTTSFKATNSNGEGITDESGQWLAFGY